jgi:hypothetical protein
MGGHVAVAALGLVALTVANPIAQSQTASPSPEKPAALTLTGCVSQQPDSGGEFTFTQANGSRYRLTGNKSVKSYAGKRVEVVSSRGGGLSVRGGLQPSVNVAAQAGAIDPAQAAIASQPGVHVTGKPDEKLPEFRVASVRAVEGSCK